MRRGWFAPETYRQRIPVVGVMGPPGPPGTSAIARAAGVALDAGQAIRATGAAQDYTAAITNLRNGRIAGITIAPYASGEQAFAQFTGALPTSVRTLDPGRPEAVGLNAQGKLVRASDPECRSAPFWAGHVNERGHITLAPRLDSHFDVRDFGALANDDLGAGDDDLVAFVAMITAMNGLVPNNEFAGAPCRVPSGRYYLSNDLFITKALQLFGMSSGKDDVSVQVRFAPGKGVITQTYTAVENPGYGYGCEINGLNFVGERLASVWADSYAGQSVPLGALVRAVNEMDSAGPGRQRVVVDAIYPDDSEANRCFRFKTHGDNRLLFECTTVGVAGLIEPAWDTTIGGITIWGSSVWTTRVCAGVHVRSGHNTIRNCTIRGFTNGGIHIAGTTGIANANDFLIENCIVRQCGAGMAIYGSEANSGLVSRVYIEASGYRPGGEAGSEGGRRGGHGMCCHGFLKSLLQGIETAGDSGYNSGRAYIIDGAAGRGASTYLYAEGDQLPSHFTGPSIHTLGPHGPGWTPTSTSFLFTGDGLINAFFRDFNDGEDRILQPIYDAKTWLAYRRLSVDGSHYLGWRFESPNQTYGTGWSWLTYFGQLGEFRALGVSHRTAPEGPGLIATGGAILCGKPGSIDTKYIIYQDVYELTSKWRNGGWRNVGDRYEPRGGLIGPGGARFIGKVVTVAGPIGFPYAAGLTYSSANAEFFIRGEIVEPNVGGANGRSYECIVGGVGGTDPGIDAWPLEQDATITIGAATFKNIGHTPTWVHFGKYEP